MVNNKLCRLFSSLSPQELSKLALFLQSPYHNQQVAVEELFQVLWTCYPQMDDSRLERKAVFAQVFPGKAFRWQSLKDLMSRLTRLIGQFLALEQMNKQPYEADLLLVQSLAERGEQKLFEQFQQALLKRIEAQPLREVSYYQSRFRLAQQAELLLGLEMKREFGPSLQIKADSLNLSFLIQKLQDFCEMLNRNNIHQQNYAPTLLEDIQELLRRHPDFLQHPAISLWYHILQTLLHPTEQARLEALVEQLRELGHFFPRDELRGMYKYALNFCIRRINAGESAYLAESFQVYQHMLTADLLSVNGYLSHTDVKNIATSAIRLGEFEWGQEFIESAREQVAEPYAQNVYTYCLALLYAGSSREREAIRLLQEVQFTDVYYALSARNLLLQIYFDQQDWDALAYQVKAYQWFLRRNSVISRRNRNLHLQFARFFKRLIRLAEKSIIQSASSLQQACTQLREELSAQEEIANRSWLLERLNRLAPTSADS